MLPPALRGERDEVLIALRGVGEDAEVVALRLLAVAVGPVSLVSSDLRDKVELRSGKGCDACLVTGLVELNSTSDVAMVGQTERRLTEICDSRHHGFDTGKRIAC